MSNSGVVINDGDDITSSMKVRILQADHPRRWRGRISPLSFDGDKRGRMRQFCEAVAFGQKFL